MAPSPSTRSARRAPAGEPADSVGGRELLQRSAFFAGLSGAELDEVLADAARQSVRRGSTLFRQGDPAAHLYLVAEGRMKVAHVTAKGEQLVLRFMGPGDLLGCAAVFRRVPYPATATAMTDATVLAWSASRMLRRVEEVPRLAQNSLALVGDRAESFVARIGELSNDPVDVRLARHLLKLAREAGRRTAEGIEIDFPVSRQDLAELSGTTLYTVSRFMREWQDLGMVASGRQRVTIRDPGRLALIRRR